MNVSKSLVIGFGCAFVAALVTIAFLIGRDSGRHRTVEPVAVVNTAAPIPPVAQPVPAPPPVAVPIPVAPVPVPTAPTIAITPSTPPAAPLPEPGDGAAVQAYFMRIDALGGGVMMGDNSQDMAEKLLASAVGGDMSGFDAMIKVADSAATAARATSVPAACAHFHSELLGMIDASVKLMNGLKNAIAKNDTGALTSIALSANSIQSRANALAAEEKQIKARFGLH